jgi:glycosyltransferase involved in cell wall biosynthesis
MRFAAQAIHRQPQKLKQDHLMSAPTISVIIPAYNAERYLDQALDSVLCQTFQDFECIVVDDGSTDSTPQIAARRERVVALRQDNQGASAARNTGIHASRGEFLTFLDADDLWYPERLKIQLEFHQRRPEIDYSHVELEEQIEEGIQVPHWALIKQKNAGLRRTLHPGGLMIRRSAMLRLGGYNPEFRVGEVTEWLSRTRATGLREERIAQTLGVVRIHGHNTSYQRDKIRKFVLKALHQSIRRKRNAHAKTVM